MFIRFPSIENTYNQRNINRWTHVCPLVTDISYALTEKLHGTNVQLIFDREKYGNVVVLGTRSHVLKAKESHYGFNEIFAEKKYQVAAERIQESAGSLYQYNVYGELFGDKVMKGIVYGKKQIRFFGVRVNGVLLPYKQMRTWFEDLSLEPNIYLAPLIAVTTSLQKAVDYRIDNIVSKLTPDNIDENKFAVRNPINLIEGVVITPLDRVVDDRGHSFILKKKNDWATERIRDPKPKVSFSKPAIRLRQEFETYITRARVESAFSKYGKRIEQTKEFQIFIPMVLNDAKEDFIKDWGDQIMNLTLTQDETKFMYNVGGKIADLLYEELGDK